MLFLFVCFLGSGIHLNAESDPDPYKMPWIRSPARQTPVHMMFMPNDKPADRSRTIHPFAICQTKMPIWPQDSQFAN